MTNRLKGTNKIKHRRGKSQPNVDNLLLKQRLEATKPPQEAYLLNPHKQEEEFTLSPNQMEIAQLMENKKDYEPHLLKNALSEQGHIRQLAKIMLNLKEKSNNLGDKSSTPQKYTIEALLNIVEEKLSSSINSSKKGERPNTTFAHYFPVQTNFEKLQHKSQAKFLTHQEEKTSPMKSRPEPRDKVQEGRIKNVEEDLRRIQMLQDMDTFRFFKDFTFPIEIESLKAFLKINKNNLHTKNIKNLMVFEKLFTDYEQVEREKEVRENEISKMIKYLSEDAIASSNFCTMKGLNNIEKQFSSHPEMTEELRKHLQSKFSTSFSMSERKQMQVMKLWLGYMKEEFVEKENVSLLNKLRNAQIIMCFSLCYL